MRIFEHKPADKIALLVIKKVQKRGKCFVPSDKNHLKPKLRARSSVI